MHLVHILLPLKDNQGRAYGKKLLGKVAEELTECFGGLTADTRAPAEGLWKDGSDSTSRDEIVTYEVMAEEIDAVWRRKYRQKLEKRFRQQELIVRAHAVRRL